MARGITAQLWREVSPYLDEALALPEAERAVWLEALRKSKPHIAEVVFTFLEDHRAMEEQRFLEDSPEQPGTEPFSRGQSVGAYRLISPIGQGGMGRVWLAERSDGRFERRVAVKFLQVSLGTQAGTERFKREGHILGSLVHPHIAELIDAGVMADGQPYLVLEYVEGEAIDEYCDSHSLDVRDRVRIFLDVLSALAHAHSSLIVHRDIKPSNVLVSKDGEVKLLDFGIAKLLADDTDSLAATALTLQGGAALTPLFAAPEQVIGASITTATDVYAAGLLLYKILTGRHPAGSASQSTADLVKAIVDVEPARPSEAVRTAAAAEEIKKRSTTPDRLTRQLRGDLDTILLKTLKKSPTERYGSITAFADDLRRYLRAEPIAARPDTLAYRARKFVRRNRLAVALSAVTAVAMIAGLAGTLIQARTARTQRDAALRARDRADRIADFMTGIFEVSDPKENVGQAVTAREVLDKAAQDINNNLNEAPEVRAQLLHVMGRAYLNLGLFSRAESLYQEGIQTSKSFGGEESRDTLSMTHDLAWAIMQQGRIAEAEGVERTLLDNQRRVLGVDDNDTLATTEELAFTVCNEGKGQCAEGIDLTQKVLERQKVILGPDARYTLVTMDNLAIMLASANRLDEALKLEQDSLDRHIRVFGTDSLDTVNAILNLGEFQRDAGHYDDAEQTFQRLLGIENRAFTPDQGETAVTKYDLASVMLRKGQKDESLSLLRQAIEHGLAPRIAQGLPKDPLFTSLHADPQFAALVAAVRTRSQAQSSPRTN
ncbi:MAG TPA: serine/threonine-protein kinase [Candidatus Acidoferrales bacterium]|nr:serine/threonine-protein kinase [Candidatus Acidoferrales bacterium]